MRTRLSMYIHTNRWRPGRTPKHGSPTAEAQGRQRRTKYTNTQYVRNRCRVVFFLTMAANLHSSLAPVVTLHLCTLSQRLVKRCGTSHVGYVGGFESSGLLTQYPAAPASSVRDGGGRKCMICRVEGVDACRRVCTSTRPPMCPKGSFLKRPLPRLLSQMPLGQPDMSGVP